ncbi:MAG: YhbY family RNA-binding protein [Oscillospiraceae bacterium]|nr:YhbY family RNA-binding protein [Oscillospiraceae bacterium]
MELTSRQRAALRSQANGLEPVIFVGHSGVTDSVVHQAEEVLTARELVKGTVLENAPVTAREACDELAERTGAAGVQVIGRKFVLFRENPEDRKVFY